MAIAEAPDLRKGAVTKQDKRLRFALWVIAVLSFAFIVDYLIGGLGSRNEEFRFVANSVAKDVLFVALATMAALDVRRWAGTFVPLLIAAHATLIVVNAAMLFTDQDKVPFLGGEIQASTFALIWMAGDAVIVAALFLLHRAAQRERHGLKYLSHLEFVSLRAMADVLIHGEGEKVDPAHIARNVDSYLHRLDAPGKKQLRLVFAGLWPFSLLGPRTRRAVMEWLFFDVVEKRWLPKKVREGARAAIRGAQQFVFLGYYGDEASHESVGYKVFSDRETPQEVSYRTVKTISHAQVNDPDIVVVGSGAAGAVLAYRLAERHPDRRVLILERGPHVHPAEFKENEVQMYLDLYNEGALQIARDFRFSVLQGMCVGGSTVINNAVCFDAPDAVLRDWNAKWDAGIDIDGPGGLKDSYQRVRQWLSVKQADPDEANPVGEYFVKGVQELGLGEAKLVDVNITSCRGCGYCNIGCSQGSKMSMLDFVLPEAQRRFKDRVQVLPECKVEKIEHKAGKATGVVCEIDGRRHRFSANTVVVAAGALHSSVLLQRSGIAPERAGQRLHFNIVTPLTAEFPKKIDAYDGLQISHWWEPQNGNGDRYVLETWFNPPATHSLVMPGWFEQHYDNMLAYDRMGAGGVVVGTVKPGSVKAGKNGPKIDYTPGDEDMDQMVDGMKQLAEIYLKSGATRVMPATYEYHEFRPGDSLDDLDQYRRDNEGLSLNSAHPQGGNAVSTDKTKGVVDSNFRVHDMEGVYVCDASVFPTSVTVNPQLTVMALADYASSRIAP